MPAKLYADAPAVETIAKRLIKNHHTHLVNARILYVFVSEASKGAGKEVIAKARRITGALEHLLQADFVIEVAANRWNDMGSEEKKRLALIDHVLEGCWGEENEKDGTYKYRMRKPDVMEFSDVLKRNGAWNDDLAIFVSIAHDVDIDEAMASIAEKEKKEAGEPVPPAAAGSASTH